MYPSNTKAYGLPNYRNKYHGRQKDEGSGSLVSGHACLLKQKKIAPN